MNKIGIILNNIGTPDSPNITDVRKYLNEFLMDPDVINLPYILRVLLVKGLIVPIRSKKSALKYQAIWTERGSPLQFLTEDLKNNLQSYLGDKYCVKIGMRYGSHNLTKAMQELNALGVKQIIFAPLFPQFAEATTASAIKYFEKENKSFNFSFKVLKAFYKEDFFINNIADIILENEKNISAQHFVFSYHGLPESQIKKTPGCLSLNCCQKPNACAGPCYKAQCHKTSELIAKKLNLNSSQWSTGFQSRLGPTKWIGPSTLEIIDQLIAENKKSVLVCSPSFVTDCLETKEELAIELNQHFKMKTQQELKVVSCLNAHTTWSIQLAKHFKTYF